MSLFKVWYSTESFADFIIDNTALKSLNPEKRKLPESDASKPKDFHKLPDHIKKIVYLDCPDLIVECSDEPVFSIEESKEAGTGHNVFQRFARLAAAVENNIPSFYIYPDAKLITRAGGAAKWDVLNPLIFEALERMMNIYNIPCLFHHFPSDYKDFVNNPSKSPNFCNKGLQFDAQHPSCPDAQHPEMKALFGILDKIIGRVVKLGPIKGCENLLGLREVQDRRKLMAAEYHKNSRSLGEISPISATTEVPTSYLLKTIKELTGQPISTDALIAKREKTVLYQADAQFRGDPYPGALAALDYLMCREGKTFENRDKNLVMIWGKIQIDEQAGMLRVAKSKSTGIESFCSDVKASEPHNLLTKKYSALQPEKIPRYYMQVRYGSMFSKSKHIRIYAYFADALLFHDGALWREG